MEHPEEKIQSGTTEAQNQDPKTQFSKTSYGGGFLYICVRIFTVTHVFLTD